MNYPLISEYIEAIKAAEENFEELKNLRPVLDEDGEPVMTSGNFAVVFKMKDEQTGKLHAVKCFLKEQEGRADAYVMITRELAHIDSPYLTPIKYLDKELFVDTNASDQTEFPVLLMDWVEGVTLDKYIQRCVNRYFYAECLDEIHDSSEKVGNLLEFYYDFGMLVHRFSNLAQWLLPQPFAHGDLKPDNILVKDDGTLVLVDYDGMYVPAMKGQKAREIGSPDFRHPSRTEDDFDEHIDDFAITSILLSLLAIETNPHLIEEYGAEGRLLFSEQDYHNLADSKVLMAIKPLMGDKDLMTVLSLFYLCSAQKKLLKDSYQLINLPEPEDPFQDENEEENLSTKVTDEDLANAWTDEFGVKYSADRKRLLMAPRDIKEYEILNGTIVICDNSFYANHNLTLLSLPSSVKIIGETSFYYCTGLKTLTLPDSVVKIKSGAFCECRKLTRIQLNDGLKIIEDHAFSGYKNITSINIPNSVVEIGNEAFWNCCYLNEIFIPRSVTKIGDGVFSYCSRLTTIIVDKDNNIYDSRNNCNAIIETSSNRLVSGCYSTIIPENILCIDNQSFYGCSGLTSITIPSSVSTIGRSAFADCTGLTSIVIPDSVTAIGNHAFDGCKKLSSIEIPNGCEKVGIYAFGECSELETVLLPNSISFIDNSSFYNCPKLESIIIPKGTREKFEKFLPEWKNKLIESTFGLELKESLYTEVKQCASKLLISLKDKDIKDIDKDLLFIELTILSSAIILALNDREIYLWRDFVQKKILNDYLSIKGVNDYDEWIARNTPGMYLTGCYEVEDAVSLAEFERENGQVTFFKGKINANPYDDSFWGEFVDKNGKKQIIYVDQGFLGEYNVSELLNNKQKFGVIQEKDNTYSYNCDDVVYCLKEIRKRHSCLPFYIHERLSFYQNSIEEGLSNQQKKESSTFQLYNAVTNEILNCNPPYLGTDDLVFCEKEVENSITGELFQYDETIMNNFSICLWNNLNSLSLEVNKNLLKA
jgi:serine/threonine protein kinase